MSQSYRVRVYPNDTAQSSAQGIAKKPKKIKFPLVSMPNGPAPLPLALRYICPTFSPYSDTPSYVYLLERPPGQHTIFYQAVRKDEATQNPQNSKVYQINLPWLVFLAATYTYERKTGISTVWVAGNNRPLKDLDDLSDLHDLMLPNALTPGSVCLAYDSIRTQNALSLADTLEALPRIVLASGFNNNARSTPPRASGYHSYDEWFQHLADNSVNDVLQEVSSWPKINLKSTFENINDRATSRMILRIAR